MPSAEAITREIREASDIVEVIGQVVTLKRSGRDFSGLCPFHNEKTPSFHVRPSEQYFKCFGCGAGGDVFTFLQMFNSVTFPEARQILADRANIRIDAGQPAAGGTTRAAMLDANRWAVAVFSKALQSSEGTAARDYLAGRGIAQEMVEAFQLGFAPESFDFMVSAAARERRDHGPLMAAGLLRANPDRAPYDVFRNRLMFPIIDPVGQVLGFGGRTLGDDVAKYINSAENQLFSKRKVLYGLHRSRAGFDRGRAVMVEGYTDVIMAHQHGFCETVAALGTSMTDQHARVLRRYVPRVIMLFDADQAGKRAAERAMEISIRSQLDVHVAALPDGLDPCDFLVDRGADDFDACLKSATSALEFKWHQTLRQQHHGDSTAARLDAVRDFVAFVGASDAFGTLDAIQRGLVINQLARLLGVSQREVNRLLSDAKERATGTERPTGGEATSSAEPVRKTVRQRLQNSEQAATADVLAIVLCEPGAYSRLADVFDPGVFDDVPLQRIARLAIDLVGQLGEFTVAEILERLEDPADASLVIELVDLARSGGTGDDQIAAARLRSESLGRIRKSKELVSGVSGSPAGHDTQDARLAALHSQVLEYTNASNFVGVRKLRGGSD